MATRNGVCLFGDAARRQGGRRRLRRDLTAHGKHAALKARLEAIRHQCGPQMNLGDVSAKSVPKMTLVSEPREGGAISTRSFIPYRCHATIGVFAAVSVATARALRGSPAAWVAHLPSSGVFTTEHPTGAAELTIELGPSGDVVRAGTVRTARKLMDGKVFPAP